MTAIIKNKFRLYNAEAFKSRVQDPPGLSENLFVFIGKSTPWPDVEAEPLGPPIEYESNDTNPPLPKDSTCEENQAWHDMLSLKRVKSSDLIHSIPRWDWDDTGNTQYIPYRACDENIFVHPTNEEVIAANAAIPQYTPGSFYVMTDEFNVYKCLGNDTDPVLNPNRLSLDKPTGTDVDAFFTADGYKWKYMYTLAHADVLKFLTNDWIPVETLPTDPSHDPENFQWAVQQNAVDGAIEAIRVVDGGFGYPDVISGLAVDSGTGGNILIINKNSFPGQTDASNYLNDTTVEFTSGAGDGDRYRVVSHAIDPIPTSTDAILTLDRVFDNAPSLGDTLDCFPTIEIIGDGSGLIATPVIIAGTGKIDHVLVPTSAQGSGYTTAAVNVLGLFGGSVSSIAQLEAIVSPKGGHGSDAVKELGGHNIMINVQFAFEEGAGDFPIANDYRKIGLVRNVIDYGTSDISEEVTLTAMWAMELTGVNGVFQQDEIIDVNAGEKQAKVVEYVELTPGPGGTGVLKFYQDVTTGFYPLTSGDVITGLDTSSVGVIDVLIPPEVEFFEGDVIYVEHRRPIMRAIDQLEDIKIIAEF